MDADTLPSPSFSLPVLRALISADSCSVFLPAPLFFFFPTSDATHSTRRKAGCLANKQGAGLDNLCIKNTKAGRNWSWR